MKSNLEILQQGYADFQKRNIPALLEVLSDQVTWELPSSAGVPFSGIFKGKDAVPRFFHEVGQLNDFREFAPDSFVAEGDKVVAPGHPEAVSKTSRNKWAHVWTFADGKVTHHYEYADTAEIKAAFF